MPRAKQTVRLAPRPTIGELAEKTYGPVTSHFGEAYKECVAAASKRVSRVTTATHTDRGVKALRCFRSGRTPRDLTVDQWQSFSRISYPARPYTARAMLEIVLLRRFPGDDWAQTDDMPRFFDELHERGSDTQKAVVRNTLYRCIVALDEYNAKMAAFMNVFDAVYRVPPKHPRDDDVAKPEAKRRRTQPAV